MSKKKHQDVDDVIAAIQDEEEETPVPAVPKIKSRGGAVGGAINNSSGGGSALSKKNQQIAQLKLKIDELTKQLNKSAGEQGPHEGLEQIQALKENLASSQTKFEEYRRQIVDLQSMLDLSSQEDEGSLDFDGIKAEITSLTASLHMVEQVFLPNSKKAVDSTLENLNPADVYVSDLNKRVQGLLSKEDPEIRKIKESIEEKGQRDPVLVVDRGPDSTPRYELVYGSTRLFCVAWINEESEKQISLVAKVLDGTAVTSLDIYELSRDENDERRDLSFYEKSCDFAARVNAILKDQPDTKITTAYEALNVAKSHAKRQMAASKIPVEVVAKFSSPNVLKQRECERLAQIVKSEEHVQAILNHDEKFADLAECLKTISIKTQPVSWGSNFQKPKEFTVANGKAVVTAGAQKGTYTIKLSGIDDEQIERILSSD